MRVLSGNILDVPRGYICHVVNLGGAFGAGLAGQIRRRWPAAYLGYKARFRAQPLGSYWTVEVERGLHVAHLAAMEKPGAHVDYVALQEALTHLREDVIDGAGEPSALTGTVLLPPLHIPWGMGCGIGKGDWKVVQRILNLVAPEAIVWRRS